MAYIDWDKLHMFHIVAEAGSFTHAGETLKLSQSAVSRQISLLEDSFKMPLFHRHARGLILTEQGEMLRETAREMFVKLAQTTARIKEGTGTPEGPLNVTTTVCFGSVWLTSRMSEFLELYPNIDVTLVLDDAPPDLSILKADVAVLMQPPRPQPHLIRRHLMDMDYVIVATPDYLKAHGMPSKVEDLDNHQIIVFGEEEEHMPVPHLNWLLEAGLKSGERRPAALEVNSTFGIFRAVQSDLGIASLPEYMLRESTNLVGLLPELQGPKIDAFIVYPEALRHSSRIAVFRDFLLRKIAEAGLDRDPESRPKRPKGLGRPSKSPVHDGAVAASAR